MISEERIPLAIYALELGFSPILRAHFSYAFLGSILRCRSNIERKYKVFRNEGVWSMGKYLGEFLGTMVLMVFGNGIGASISLNKSF